MRKTRTGERERENGREEGRKNSRKRDEIRKKTDPQILTKSLLVVLGRARTDRGDGKTTDAFDKVDQVGQICGQRIGAVQSAVKHLRRLAVAKGVELGVQQRLGRLQRKGGKEVSVLGRANLLSTGSNNHVANGGHSGLSGAILGCHFIARHPLAILGVLGVRQIPPCAMRSEKRREAKKIGAFPPYHCWLRSARLRILTAKLSGTDCVSDSP